MKNLKDMNRMEEIQNRLITIKHIAKYQEVEDERLSNYYHELSNYYMEVSDIWEKQLKKDKANIFLMNVSEMIKEQIKEVQNIVSENLFTIRG